MIARSSSSSPQEPRSLLTGLRIEAAQPQEAKESMQEASSLQQLSYTGLLPYGFWWEENLSTFYMFYDNYFYFYCTWETSAASKNCEK